MFPICQQQWDNDDDDDDYEWDNDDSDQKCKSIPYYNIVNHLS